MIFLDDNYIIVCFIEEHEFHGRAKEIERTIAKKERIISRW
jgi:predicted nucleic acid-binding protein